MSNLKPVKVYQDDSGHWYVVPDELSYQFHSMLRDCIESDDWEPFETTFGEYKTGGDLNLIQLYAEI